MATALFFGAVPFAFAATSQLQNRYDQMAHPTVSATTTHIVGFTVTDPTSIGSVVLEFCSNSPIDGIPCVPPAGFSMSSASLVAQTGETGFSIDPSSTANRVLLTRTLAAPIGGPSTYRFDNVINPSSPGTFYLRMSTYISTAGTGTSLQDGGTALAIVGGVSVAATVPPFLRFCVSVTITNQDCSSATSYLIDIGELKTTAANKASWEFVVATNAGFGYSITMVGTTLTSGNNVIPALATQASSQPGTSQFGVNLRSNSNPGIGAEPNGPGTGGVINAAYNSPNQFRFNSGDIVVSSTGVDDLHKFTTSFVANVSKSQPAGVYTTTISYICLANF